MIRIFESATRNIKTLEEIKETEEQIQERVKKQSFLKTEILEKYFNPSCFEEFLENQKENGSDIGSK